MMLLLTGSYLLTIPLDNEKSIPLGTFITWAGMIALPLTLYLGAKGLRKPFTKLNKILNICLKIILVLGILWVPLSYMLAGNLSFTFTEKESFQGGQTAMKWFWRLSYGIGIGTVLILLVHGLASLFKRNKVATNIE